ncbi:MAG: SLBB domain-containing protein [Rhizomicrobium sp.]|jgi:protein involved in polysaccharide export with SLBB domain
MTARRFGRWAILAAAGMFLAAVGVQSGANGQQSSTTGSGVGAGYCATTPDPAACQQLLNSAISQGLVPQGAASGQLQLPGTGQPGGEVNGIIPGPPPSVTVTPVQPLEKRPRERSHLEDIYSQRAGTELHQFGYDLIGNGGTISALQIGAIQDDYILGQGDAIIVTLRGQENATYNIFVDRDGNVTLPRLRPVSAAGRRFGDFRDELNSAIKQGYLQTQAYITMGQVRQISVNVVGEVTNPGVYALSGLSSMLDALNVAGGVKKTGSLRKVSVDRDGKKITVDLYKFLSPDGYAPNVTLRQGDRIIVAPLGATVAISGDVRRPGIYELPSGVGGVSAREVLSLANGYAIRGKYRLTTLRTHANGTQEYVDMTAHAGAEVRDGEILTVNAAVNYAAGNVTLAGNARLPGVYALNRARTLHELLPDARAFLPLTYMPFGFIMREDPQTLRRSVIPFSVELLIEGKFDAPLQSQDVVHILTFNAMRELLGLRTGPNSPQANQQNMRPALTPATGIQQPVNCPPATQATSTTTEAQGTQNTGNGGVSQQLMGLLANSQANAWAGCQQAGRTTATPSPMTMMSAGQMAAPGTGAQSSSEDTSAVAQGGPPSGTDAGSMPSAVEGLTADEAATVGFVVTDYRVTIDGAVRAPGDYLAVPGVPLDEIIDAANGLTPDADLNSVEITSTAIDNIGGMAASTRKMYSLTPQSLTTVSLLRLDVVHIPNVMLDQQEGSIDVEGEVQFPGTYHLLRGERLSSVLQRAGGLTREAYPIGAIFQRPSIADVREAAYEREADDLQKQLIASVAQGGSALASANGVQGGLNAEAAAFVADVIRQLRTKPADGRMSVIADPAALAADPQADIELRPGDKLLIPKRPSEVDVTGEVLNPGSFRFNSKLNVADYINLSGGYDRYADDDHIFVINPDGTSRRISDDLFDFDPPTLAPGTVIVVPRDLRPLDLGFLTVTVTKVMSDLAISAASLAVLSKNN